MVRPKSGKTFRGKVWGTHRCTELWAVGCALETQIASEMERQGLLQPCMYIQGWGGELLPREKGKAVTFIRLLSRINFPLAKIQSRL